MSGDDGLSLNLKWMIEDGYEIRAFCANVPICRHSAILDLQMLVQRLGWTFDDFASPHLRQRLICSHCANRFPQLIIIPSSHTPGSAGALHPPATMSVAESAALSIAQHKTALDRDAAAGHPPPTGKRWRKFGR